MGQQFSMEITLGNEAMQASDIERTLTGLARVIGDKVAYNAPGALAGKIIDNNGNTVGRWRIGTPLLSADDLERVAQAAVDALPEPPVIEISQSALDALETARRAQETHDRRVNVQLRIA